MAEYRFYTVHMLSGNIVADMPMLNVNCDKVFSGAGNFSGALPLGTGKYDDSALLSNSYPGRHAIVVRRDDDPIWAGPLWNRSYDSESRTMQYNAQTYESVFSKIAIRVDMSWTLGSGYVNAEDTVLWTNMLNNLQSQDSAAFNFGITLSHPGALTGRQRNVDFLASEFKYYQELVDQLAGFDNGYGYTINIGSGSGDTITKTMQLVLNAISAPHMGLDLDYPGPVAKYWLQENASRGGVRHVGLASSLAPGASMPSAVVDNTDQITAGLPPWYNVQSFTDPQSDQDLINKTTQMGVEQRMPITTPTFELSPGYDFSNWNDLGKRMTVRITDVARFPDSTINFPEYFEQRMMGWSVNVPTNSTPEVIRLQTEGVS